MQNVRGKYGFIVENNLRNACKKDLEMVYFYGNKSLEITTVMVTEKKGNDLWNRFM